MLFIQKTIKIMGFSLISILSIVLSLTVLVVLLNKMTPEDEKNYRLVNTIEEFDAVTLNETKNNYNYTFYQKGSDNQMSVFDIDIDKRDNLFISDSGYELIGKLELEIKSGEKNQYILDLKKNHFGYDPLYNNKITIILDEKTKIKKNENH